MSPGLPFYASPAARTTGTCRACGCTDESACVGGCSWVEEDLCSACHGPAHPTRRQAGEIARVEARNGPVRVTRGRGLYELEVALVGGSDLGSHFVVRPAVLTLSAVGHVVHRLEREVTPREQTAA